LGREGEYVESFGELPPCGMERKGERGRGRNCFAKLINPFKTARVPPWHGGTGSANAGGIP